MKKLYSLLLILLLPIFCFAQKGSIKGSVFYKYNNYVGNRADAGATVYLFYPHNNNHFKETTADLSGNFYFENLDTGKYLLVAKSNEVWQSAETHVQHIYYSHANDYFGVDIKTMAKSLYDSMEIYKNSYDSIYWSKTKRKKDEKDRKIKSEAALNNYMGASERIDQYLDLSPYKDLNFALFQLKGHRSLEFKEVKLTSENTSTSVVFDFGLSQF